MSLILLLRQQSADRCFIDNELLADAGGRPQAIREVHHLVPQAYGGKNGPTVPLCIAHHDLVHLIASKKIAQLNWRVLLPEDENQSHRLDLLSEVIVRAHQRVSNDPNKRVSLGVTMSKAASAQVDELCKFHQLSRQDLLLKLLSEEYTRLFPSRKPT